MPPPPSERRSIIQDFFFALWLSQFPAFTIQVILRSSLGFRLLNPVKLILVTGLLAVIAIMQMPYNPDARPIDLLIFAFVVLIMGLAKRFRRWWDLDRNARQHSYDIGNSPFDFRWLPNFVRRNRLMARFFDPVFCALIGVALLPYSRALAIWLIISAVSLRCQEDMVFRRQRNRALDLADALILADQQTKVFEQFEQTQNVSQHQPDGGVNTGIGDDIQGHIIISIKKRRKQKTNENTIDI